MKAAQTKHNYQRLAYKLERELGVAVRLLDAVATGSIPPSPEVIMEIKIALDDHIFKLKKGVSVLGIDDEAGE